MFYARNYVRFAFRGAFSFRIVHALLDKSDEIRHLTTFYLQQRLLKRKPKIIYHHFIESLFHYNEYQVRPATLGNLL